jgi:hypothetical protein
MEGASLQQVQTAVKTCLPVRVSVTLLGLSASAS